MKKKSKIIECMGECYVLWKKIYRVLFSIKKYESKIINN